MELELKNGDYVPDGIGGVRRVSGREALAQRVLFRLTARRGSFPFWPELGSLPTSQRSAAAVQYVTEALAQEPVDVEEVILTPQPGGTAELQVRLSCQDTGLDVMLEVQV